ncbi:TPA: hypothetical protein HA231_04950 [Candidatus Woesearchaeota archaeon]|nr:hypothetical protein [Candidatus Woesearchaeota archaeon]
MMQENEPPTATFKRRIGQKGLSISAKEILESAMVGKPGVRVRIDLGFLPQQAE